MKRRIGKLVLVLFSFFESEAQHVLAERLEWAHELAYHLSICYNGV
jgi:hypothetical protein